MGRPPRAGPASDGQERLARAAALALCWRPAGGLHSRCNLLSCPALQDTLARDSRRRACRFLLLYWQGL